MLRRIGSDHAYRTRPLSPLPGARLVKRRLVIRAALAVALGVSVWFLSDALLERTQVEQR